MNSETISTVSSVVLAVYAWTHSIKRCHMAGKDLTEYMSKLLNERGAYFETTGEKNNYIYEAFISIYK